MTICTITPAQASDLYSHASAIRDFLAVLPVVDAAQMTLDLGTDQALEESMEEREVHLQAIEAFMEEREQLKAMIADRIDCTNDLLAENAMLSDRLVQAAHFYGKLRTLLSQAGIAYEANYNGDPVMTIDVAATAAYVEQAYAAPRF